MAQLQITPAPISLPASTTEQKVVTAFGDTVYYGGPTVSSSSYTGTLTTGQQLKVSATTWFVTAADIGRKIPGGARLAVVDFAVPSPGPVKVVAHVPTDADFPYTPPDGTEAVNSATGFEYVRTAGAWVQTTTAGTPGSGALGVDVWASQGSPGSVTDWGPVINSLISGGARRLLFQAHTFPFSTPIVNVGADAPDVIFEGIQALRWLDDHGSQYTGGGAILLWKGGAGTGSALNFRGTQGMQLRDLAILYDNAAFDGCLIDLRAYGITGGPDPGGTPFTWSSDSRIERCRIGAKVPDSYKSARCLIDWNGHIMGHLDGCTLAGAQRAISGQYNMNSDDCHISTNLFLGFTVAFFTNVGRFWKFHNNYIINGEGGTACPQIVGCEDWDGVAGHGMGTGLWTEFVWESNSVWDPGTGGTCIFNQGVAHPWNLTAIGNNLSWLGSVTEMVFHGSGRIHVEGFNFTRAYRSETTIPYIDCGDPATAPKEQLVIRECYMSSPNAGDLGAIINATGHGATQIGPFSYKGAPAVHAVHGHERLMWSTDIAGGYPYSPAVTKVAGQPAGLTTFGIYGSDMAGVVGFNSGGSGANAGGVLDVAFGQPMVSDPSALTGRGGTGSLCVLLTPIENRNSSPNGPETVDAGAYVSVAVPTTTGWRLCVRNAVPANKNIQFAYRILKL